jgi:hypothetical protein
MAQNHIEAISITSVTAAVAILKPYFNNIPPCWYFAVEYGK